jgi:hypothetical protein
MVHLYQCTLSSLYPAHYGANYKKTRMLINRRQRHIIPNKYARKRNKESDADSIHGYPFTLSPFTPLPLYPLPLYPFTPLPFYPFTLLPFYTFTLLLFYPFTPLTFYLLPLYPSTPLPFYPWCIFTNVPFRHCILLTMGRTTKRQEC